MKKNAMLKIAAILLVAVLLTTCAISSTFAKYTTSTSAKTLARVAKFGVTATTKIDKLFSTEYSSAAGKTVISDPTDKVEIGGNQVVWNVVAPGTGGTVESAIFVKGKPEVTVNVTPVVTVTLDGWSYGTNNSTKYCPLVFTVDGKEYKVSTETGSTITTPEALATAVKTAIENACTKGAASKTQEGVATYAPNTDLNTDDTIGTVAISWSWPFEGNNVADTALGDKAVANDIKVAIDFSIDITQVD